MMDKLLKVLEVIEKIPSIILVALMIYAYHWYTTDTPKVVKTDGVTINTVTQDLNINGDVRDKAETYEEIEKNSPVEATASESPVTKSSNSGLV